MLDIQWSMVDIKWRPQLGVGTINFYGYPVETTVKRWSNELYQISSFITLSLAKMHHVIQNRRTDIRRYTPSDLISVFRFYPPSCVFSLYTQQDLNGIIVLLNSNHVRFKSKRFFSTFFSPAKVVIYQNTHSSDLAGFLTHAVTSQ